MRIILSRKGFDSSSGGCPSPILPDGRLRSLPIPYEEDKTTYSQIYAGNNYPTGDIVTALTNGKITADSFAHFDPDLDCNAVPNRHPDWRGVFGQSGQSQGHLREQGIGIGDLFLFFGLYRQTEGNTNDLKFVKGSPEIHAIWGYLQIGEIVPVTKDTACDFPQFVSHPHVSHPQNCTGENVLYIGKPYLEVPGLPVSLSGFGVFPTFRSDLQLTAEGHNTSTWCLPHWFANNLTYNLKDVRWNPCETDASKVLLDSARPGQEFVVVNLDETEAVEWLNQIFACAK